MMARLVESDVQERLRAYDLTVPEFSCLLGLLEADGPTQSELGRLTGAPEYSTSRYIDRLVKRGMVKRKPHPNSRRAMQVFLTPTGRQMAKKMPDIVRQTNESVLAGLTQNQRAKLEVLLGKAIDHLGSARRE